MDKVSYHAYPAGGERGKQPNPPPYRDFELQRKCRGALLSFVSLVHAIYESFRLIILRAGALSRLGSSLLVVVTH